MTSDEKRREVAAKLRAEAESWRYYREDDNAFCMNDHEFTEAVLDDFGFDDADMPAYKVFDQMADLIDRQTCHVTSRPGNYENDVCDSCSVCGFGWHKSRFDPPYRYCPNCGAEVTKNGGCDVREL